LKSMLSGAIRGGRIIAAECLRGACRRRLNRLVAAVLLDDEIGNLFNTAEILNLEVSYVDLRLEALFDVKQQLHELLRVKYSRNEQIGVDGRHVDVHHLRKQGRKSGLHCRLIRFGHFRDHISASRSPGRKNSCAPRYLPPRSNLLTRTHSSPQATLTPDSQDLPTVPGGTPAGRPV